MAWTTPKTDWDKSDYFAYTDYNRIKNNLIYINNMLNEQYPEKAKPLDLGADLTYAGYYLPSKFNAFEDALESFTRIGEDANIGERNTYQGNAPFIGYEDLNRIEKDCLRWYNINPIISSVSITPASFEIESGDTQQLTLTVTPSNARYTVVWSSSNASVATVSDGVVTGVGDGSTVITATVKQAGRPDKIATCNCAVIVLATSISITPTDMDITWYERRKYDVTVYPSNATHRNDYTLVSHNENIAKVVGQEIRTYGETGRTTVDVSVDNVSATVGIYSVSLPVHFSSGVVAFNGVIHVLGGNSNFGGNTDTHADEHHYRYNGLRWYESTYLPFKTYNSAVVVFNNEIHILGGKNAIESFDYHYKWNGSEWISVSRLPYKVGYLNAVVFNNEIHILGGVGHTTEHYKWNGSEWVFVSTLPYDMISSRNKRAVVYNNEIHIFHYEDKRQYKWNGTRWESVSVTPINTNGADFTVYNGKIHLVGSYDDKKVHYTYDGNTWTKEADLRLGSYDSCCAVFNNILYKFDGGNSSNDFDENNSRNVFIVDDSMAGA